MALKRVQKETTPAKQESKETEVQAKTPDNAQEVKDELDELLDEIDSVLEENAEEFVKNYVLEGRRIDVARTPRSVTSKQLSLVGGQ